MQWCYIWCSKLLFCFYGCPILLHWKSFETFNLQAQACRFSAHSGESASIGIRWSVLCLLTIDVYIKRLPTAESLGGALPCPAPPLLEQVQVTSSCSPGEAPGVSHVWDEGRFLGGTEKTKNKRQTHISVSLPDRYRKPDLFYLTISLAITLTPKPIHGPNHNHNLQTLPSP